MPLTIVWIAFSDLGNLFATEKTNSAVTACKALPLTFSLAHNRGEWMENGQTHEIVPHGGERKPSRQSMSGLSIRSADPRIAPCFGTLNPGLQMSKGSDQTYRRWSKNGAV